MPELPEVEVTRATLADRMLGALVVSARLGKPLRWPLGCEPDLLRGRRVGTLGRRGKYLWMPLTVDGRAVDGNAADAPDAEPDGGLLLHLGMSGSLKLSDPASAVGESGPHDHFELVTSRGTLRLTDPRRFGAVVWSPSLTQDPAAKLLSRLGAEPFDPALTPERLHAAFQARGTTVKAALLAGDIVVGAGNIYACEALFGAGIDPRMRCNALSRPQCERLLATLRLTLARAIALGGTTLRDFKDAHGMSGAFQNEALVYGREGDTCGRCGGTVRRIVQAQRSTYFCGGCQRR